MRTEDDELSWATLTARTPESCPQRHTHGAGRACGWCDYKPQGLSEGESK